jgi:hypothetical protein
MDFLFSPPHLSRPRKKSSLEPPPCSSLYTTNKSIFLSPSSAQLGPAYWENRQSGFSSTTTYNNLQLNFLSFCLICLFISSLSSVCAWVRSCCAAWTVESHCAMLMWPTSFGLCLPLCVRGQQREADWLTGPGEGRGWVIDFSHFFVFFVYVFFTW